MERDAGQPRGLNAARGRPAAAWRWDRGHWPTGDPADVADTLVDVRDLVRTAEFPLAVPSARGAHETARVLREQLDDYLIPRLRRVDAPMLAVVGGSTGAGKSTLVNSLVRAPVSAAGVLRPTTRAPLLVCNPTDLPWFSERELLPALARSNRPAAESLQIINAPALRPGLALLDAPDIDSIVAENRRFAIELLGVADLWLFVTTAVRYADAVPWRLLREARDRGTAIAIVLDRVPPEVRDDIAAHFARMLADRDLGGAPLFVIGETRLDQYGLLPETESIPVKRWLDGVAGSAARRREVTVRTLLGAVSNIGGKLRSLAAAAADQAESVAALTAAVDAAYDGALADVAEGLATGVVLRGETYPYWRELITTGELRYAWKARTAPRRTLAERPPPGRPFQAAVLAAVANMITEADAVAAQSVRDQWRLSAPGRVLLASGTGLGRPWPGFGDAAHDLVHGWQAWLRAAARDDAPRVRTQTRSFATASTVLLATVVAVAPPPDDVTAAGPGPELLRDLLADPAVRELGEEARAELIRRVEMLNTAEVDRHLAALPAARVEPELAQALRDAAGTVGSARSAMAAHWGTAA